MLNVIGDAGAAGASTPAVPPTPPSGPAVGAFVSVLVGWLMIATLIARRLRVFQKSTVVGPQRVASDESPWLPTFLFFSSFAVAGIVGPALARSIQVSAARRTFVDFHASRLTLVLMVVLGMIYFRRRGLSLLGFTASGLRRGVVGGAILIFTLFPVVSVVSELTSAALHWAGRPQPLPHQVLQAIHDNGNDHVLLWLLVTAAVITAPLSEEIMFRGCLQTAFAYGFEWMFALLRPRPVALQPELIGDHGSPQILRYASPAMPNLHTEHPGVAARWCAILVAAAVFAAVHGVWAFAPPLFVLAVGLGFAYEMTGNLWVTIVAHAAFNATQILIFHAIS